MQVIAIAMQKGGVGKSTLARSLAVAAVQDGLSVLIVDMDAQQSVSQCAERRKADTPVVVFSTENELPEKLAQARMQPIWSSLIHRLPAQQRRRPLSRSPT